MKTEQASFGPRGPQEREKRIFNLVFGLQRMQDSQPDFWQFFHLPFAGNAMVAT